MLGTLPLEMVLIGASLLGQVRKRGEVRGPGSGLVLTPVRNPSAIDHKDLTLHFVSFGLENKSFEKLMAQFIS